MPEWDQDSSVNLCRIGERREKGVKKPLLATRLSCPWEQPEGEGGGGQSLTLAGVLSEV